MKFLITGITLLFFQLSFGQCCNYVLSTQDSFGDGWNGAELNITNGGLNIGTYEATGSGTVFTLTLCDGDNIELIYSSGIYENENSFTLTAPDGTVLYSVASNPPVGNIFSFTVSGCPTCTDGIQNGGETGIDCGGCNCGPCVGTPAPPSPASMNASANINNLPCGGGPVDLSANASTDVPVLDNNFDDGTPGTGWNVTPAAQFDNPCGPGVVGTHLWMGSATAAPRTLETAPLNMPCGGEICFYFKFTPENSGDVAPCEGADLYNEGVNLQFSTSCGAGWTDIAYFAPNGDLLVSNPNTTAPTASGATNFTTWDQYCFTVPANQGAPDLTFQWYQSGSSGNSFDHWGLDEVTIDAFACEPYYVDWEHIPGSPDASDVTSNVTVTTDFPVIYTNGVNDTIFDTVTVFVDAVQDPIVTITPELCAGDDDASISVGVTGGTGPYDWQLFLPNGTNTTITSASPANFGNLAPGNYTLTITDQAGCSISKPFTIDPGPVCCEVVATGTDLNCNPTNANCDGTVTANPANGIAPYTYQWYTGVGTASPIGGSITQTVGGLCAGTYTVQVTDATGCIITDQVTIAEPSALTFTATPTPALCNGASDGTITVAATGGTAPYQYSLNGGAFQAANNFSSLTAGNYSIAVEDNAGCSTNQTVIVAEPNQLNLSIDNINDATCNNPNGSLNLSATGGNAPYTYDLGTVNNTTGNFLGLPSNTYNIILTDVNGCIENGVVTIVDIAGPTATINTISDISCNGGANGFVIIDANNGAAPYTYALDAGPPQTSNTFTNLTANNYTVTVTDNNNCVGTVNLTINQPAQLSYTTTITDASCSGTCDGAIDFTVVGGTVPYQFSTDNGFTFNGTNPVTGLCAGNYNTVVTDAQGCLANSTETIIEPPGFNLVINANNATCGFDNGNVTFTIGGASGSGYQLDWNNTGFGTTFSFIDLDAGAYPYTVSDGTGCAQSGFVDISDILGAEIQVLSQTPTSCFGFTDGQVTVETIQGTNPINYFLDGVAYGLSNLALIEGYNWSNVAGGPHLIYIEDANGCQTFQSISIAQPQEITYSTISEDVNCNGGNDAFMQINATGGVGSFNYSIDNGTTQTPVNFFGSLIAGTYNVLIEDADGCQVTGTEIISEPLLLTANANTVDLICNGDCDGQILFDPAVGGTAPYIYSIDNGTTNSGATTFNALCAGTYNLQVTDANNCLFTNTIDILEPSPVSITATQISTTCNLSNGEINVVGAGGTIPYQYALDNGPMQGGTNFNGLAPVIYEALVTDFNGCSDSINLAVTALDVPILDFLTPTNPLCFGSNNGQILVTASGGVGALTYSIDGLNFVPSNLFSGLSAGTYTITIKDANDCLDSETVTLTDPAVLAIDNITESATDCFNNANGTFSIAAIGGTLPYQYDLGIGNGFGPTNTANFLTAGTYNFIVEDANGCQINGSATITQPQLLEFSPANSTTSTSCFGTCDGTITTTVIGGTAPYFYNWSSNIATVNDNNAVNVCAGMYSVIVTDINGCQVTDNALMVNEPPLVTINSVLTDSVNCFGESSGEIIIDAPNATTFNITDNNGINLTQNNGVFTGLPIGSYSVSVEDANGCEALSSTTLYEPTPIALSTNSDLVACLQDEISISAIASGGNGIYTFNWSNSATTNSTQLIYPTAPEFISVTVTDQYGCTAPAEGFNVTVNPPVSLNPIPDVFICPGDQITLTGTFNDGLPDYSLQWEHEADTSATTTVSPIIDTQYTLSIRDFCADVDTIEVNVFMNGVPNLTLIGAENGCVDHTITLSIDDPNGDVGGGCTWDFGDGNMSNQCNNVTNTYVTPGVYDINFAFTTSAGCVVDTTYTQAIEVYAQPIADFTFNPNNPNVDDPTVNFTNLSQNEDSYIWDFSGLGTSSLENPSFTFPSLQPDDYSVCLTALSTNGNVVCSDQICETISIADAFSMYVPNTFTPDNDSYNPVFLPVLSGNDIYEYNLTIFNRWGEILFESNNQAVGWDGTYGGEPVKDGTYIWRISAREIGKIKDVLFTGHVNVIR